MNTKVEFSAWTSSERTKVYKIFDEGFKQFHIVIDRFSRFKEESELSRLNHSQGKPFKVSKELLKLVKSALEIAELTDGAFDPTIIDFLEAYGYKCNYNFSKLEKKDLIRKEIKSILQKRPSYKDIKINRKQKSITLQEKQKIDLGGIGKGYAIDLAYEKLKPLENFLINAGGDIRAKGTNKDRKHWLVELYTPTSKQKMTLRLKNEAVCCSGSWARKVKFFHHLINPKTGKPECSLKTAFVISKTAMKADPWATALFILGKNAERYIKRHKIKSVLVDSKDKLHKFLI